MKILYDHQAFEMQRVGEISRYFIELMSRLPSDVSFVNSVVFSNNVYLKNAGLHFRKGITYPLVRGIARIVNPINELMSKYNVKKGDYDIFHPTYYSPYFFKHIKRPYVITVHDMIHEKFSRDFPASDTTVDNKKKLILNADRIIAISHNTKKDIMEIYGIDDAKIDVVYHGRDEGIAGGTPIDNLPDKYILYVGARGLYKNFGRFLSAFSIISKKYPEIKLVCTGSPFNAQEKENIRKLGLVSDVYQYFISDTQLEYLYQHALCFVYPSLYEGFGIPILEAFEAKCPTVLSNTSCFPEIAGDGAMYFDPYEIESMADSLFKIVEDDSLRDELVMKGKIILKNYSWDKTVAETCEVYRKAL